MTLPGLPLGLPLLGSGSSYVSVSQNGGWLAGPGTTERFTVTLEGGVAYKIPLSVPWNADFDIEVVDENGHRVASGSSRGRGSSETVYVTPIWTGAFYMRVRSSSGSGPFTVELWKRL